MVQINATDRIGRSADVPWAVIEESLRCYPPSS